ncbi:MAG: hypothetical protein HYT71_04145 [Candidatus Aenigmarchaeota archaeon]|nr:hypothetical protein [Candidatus Aenigmarchaeota archaeon]
MMLGKTQVFILSIALFAMLSNSASASKVDMASTISDMSICTGSFTNQLVKLTNVGATTDTYKLNSDSNLVTFAGCTSGSVSNNEVVLASGESTYCSIFIGPSDNATAQKYPITLSANSESSADLASTKINVDVINCNSASLTTQGSLEVCARDKFSTSIIIKNTGKYVDTFNISADAAGKFDKTLIKLEPNQSGIVNFESSYEKASVNKIKFNLKSEKADTGGLLEVNVRECFNFAASVSQPSGPICLRKPVTFNVNILNTGSKADVFEIISEAELSQRQISLNGSSNATIKAVYNPDKEGKFKLNISVKSGGSNAVKTLYPEAEAKECGSISLLPQVSSGSICKNEEFTYSIDVKNIGAVADLFSMNATKGVLDVSKVIIEPGKSGTVKLKVNSTELVENKTNEIIFTAFAGSLEESTKLQLNVGVCHNATIKVVPESLTVCSPDRASFKLEIRNTGRRPEVFTVSAVGNKIAENLLIPENATKTLEFVANYSNETGIYRIDGQAVSENLNIKSTGALVVKDYQSCYGGSLTSTGKKDVKPSDKSLQELQIRNTGIKTLNYILQAAGPSWVSIGVSNITLEPNETNKVYLFIAPPFGTTLGNYNTTVIALSEKGVASNIQLTTSVVSSPTTTLKSANATTTTTMPVSDGQRQTVVIGIILAMAGILVLRHIFTSK